MSAPTRGNRPTSRTRDDRPRVVRDSPTVYVSRRRLPLLDRLGDRLPKPSDVGRPAAAAAGSLRGFASSAVMHERVRPFGIASAVAAGWAVGMGLLLVLVPVLLTWALAAHATNSARDAIVMAADIWLGAHHVPFSVGGGTFGLLPLGLLVLPFLMLRASGGWAARILRPSTLPDAGLLVAATAIVYGLLGLVVAALAGRPDLHAAPWEAALWCTAVAFVSVGWTVVRTCGLGDDLAAVLPTSLVAVLRPAVVGLFTVLAGSAVIVLGSLVVHGGDALALSRALDGGLVGTVVLVLLCLLYLPNLIVWGAAFCVGPGFAVGAGTSVTLAGVSSGPLPAFPLFAAVPSSGVPPAWAWICLLVPVAGGVVAARSTTVRRPELDPESLALWAGLAGVVAGTGLGVLAWLAGGPLGAERLSTVGPSAWQVGTLAALELGLVAAVTAWLLGWRRSRV